MFKISVLQFLLPWLHVHHSSKPNKIPPHLHLFNPFDVFCRTVKFYRCHFSLSGILYLQSTECDLIGKLTAIAMTQCLFGKWTGQMEFKSPLFLHNHRPPVANIALNLKVPLGKSLPPLNAPKGKPNSIHQVERGRGVIELM